MLDGGFRREDLGVAVDLVDALTKVDAETKLVVDDSGCMSVQQDKARTTNEGRTGQRWDPMGGGK